MNMQIKILKRNLVVSSNGTELVVAGEASTANHAEFELLYQSVYRKKPELPSRPIFPKCMEEASLFPINLIHLYYSRIIVPSNFSQSEFSSNKAEKRNIEERGNEYLTSFS